MHDECFHEVRVRPSRLYPLREVDVVRIVEFPSGVAHILGTCSATLTKPFDEQRLDVVAVISTVLFVRGEIGVCYDDPINGETVETLDATKMTVLESLQAGFFLNKALANTTVDIEGALACIEQVMSGNLTSGLSNRFSGALGLSVESIHSLLAEATHWCPPAELYDELEKVLDPEVFDELRREIAYLIGGGFADIDSVETELMAERVGSIVFGLAS